MGATRHRPNRLREDTRITYPQPLDTLYSELIIQYCAQRTCILWMRNCHHKRPNPLIDLLVRFLEC
jgi:hypothetical protein